MAIFFGRRQSPLQESQPASASLTDHEIRRPTAAAYRASVETRTSRSPCSMRARCIEPDKGWPGAIDRPEGSGSSFPRNEIPGYGVMRLMGWRKRLALWAMVLLTVEPVAMAPTEPVAAVGSPAPVLKPEGIGAVRFGTAKAKAVTGLSSLFGRPSSQGANTGCGPRYSEVEWGELVAEFRSGIFSGYRYLVHGWPLTTPGSPHVPPSLLHGPRLATAKGISLGNTLGQLRSAYPGVHFVGVDKWQVLSGVVFVVDAAREPESPSSKIIEIKFGTCGDF